MDELIYQKTQKLIDYMRQSKRIVFFGGAGVSTESGVPDFRSKDGLYNQHDVQFDMYEPEYLLSHDCLFRKPKVFYEYYRQKMDARNIQPNITHLVLAELEEKGLISGIVTQNIDGLHQKAGSKKVYEIHGTTRINYCCTCNKKFDENFIFDSDEPVPHCPECGGQVRPAVTMYQEGLPEDQVYMAEKCISEADMLIVAGTSLKVYPAASFVNFFSGDHLAVINKERLSIQLNPDTDITLQCGLGEVFKEIKKELL